MREADTLSTVPLADEVIRVVREDLARKRWSDAELARRLGWAQVRMSRTLNARRNITLANLEEIVSALGVDWTVIVDAIENELRHATKRGEEKTEGVDVQEFARELREFADRWAKK